MESICIKDISVIKDQARCEFFFENSAIHTKIFTELEAINADIITKNPHYTQGERIFINIDGENVPKLMESMQKYTDFRLEVRQNLAKLCISGIGVKSNVNVLYKIIYLLSSNGIQILTISTSEVKIAILINEKDTKLALQVLQDLLS